MPAAGYQSNHINKSLAHITSLYISPKTKNTTSTNHQLVLQLQNSKTPRSTEKDDFATAIAVVVAMAAAMAVRRCHPGTPMLIHTSGGGGGGGVGERGGDGRGRARQDPSTYM
jgi:ATP-dependent protease ClpP protease subunit